MRCVPKTAEAVVSYNCTVLRSKLNHLLAVPFYCFTSVHTTIASNLLKSCAHSVSLEGRTALPKGTRNAVAVRETDERCRRVTGVTV